LEQALELVRFAHEFYGSLDVMQWTPGIPGDLAYPELAKTARGGRDAGEPPGAHSSGGDLVSAAKIFCAAHHLERAAVVGPYSATPNDPPLPSDRDAPSRMVAVRIDSEPDPDLSVV
jgi:hypothetical protein